MSDPQDWGQNDKPAQTADWGAGDKPAAPKSLMDHLSDAAGEIWKVVNPASQAQGAVSAVNHPGAFLSDWGKQNQGIANKAQSAFEKGNYAEGVAHSVNYLLNAIPGLGGASENAADSFQQGEWGKGIGQSIAPALAVAEGKYLPAAAGKIGSGLKTVSTEILGKTTGAGATALRTALEKPSVDFTNAMRGNVDEMDILQDAKDALQNVKDQRGAAYREALSKIPGNQMVDITPVRAQLGKALLDHNVRMDTQTGILDFSRSTISDATAQSAVKSIYSDVKDWGSDPQDLTPHGVDILKRRIDDLYAPTSNARAVVQSVKSATRNVLNSQVPGYQDMTRDYAQASEFLDQLKDLSLEGKNPGTAIRKLTTILNQNNNYRQMLVDGLTEHTSADLPGELAGLALSKPTARGIMGPLSGFGAIAEGGKAFSGSLSPYALAGLLSTSPRLMGEVMQLVGKAPELNGAGLQAVSGLGTAKTLTASTSPRLEGGQ